MDGSSGIFLILESELCKDGKREVRVGSESSGARNESRANPPLQLCQHQQLLRPRGYIAG